LFNLIFLLYFYILFSIMSYFFQSYFFCFYFFNRNYIRLFMILMNKNIKYHLNGGGHFGVNHFLKFLFLSLILIFLSQSLGRELFSSLNMEMIFSSFGVDMWHSSSNIWICSKSQHVALFSHAFHI